MIRYPDDVAHSAVMSVDLGVYTSEALFRVLYRFTGEYFVYVAQREANSVDVYLTVKDSEAQAAEVAGRFANALVDERVRRDIAAETRSVRELLVAEALAAADLLDDSGTEADYHDDPRRIAQ
ncbi:MAG: His-Xaa-Ser system protein HxsD [Acidobacteriota bacterium]